MTKKPHIAHILYSFGTGGLEKGVATLISNASRGFEHTVVCLAGAGESTRLLPRTTRVIDCGKKPGTSLRFVAQLARILRSLKPDLVHTRNWSGMDGILAANLAGIRRVVHGEHGWGMEDPQGLNRKRLLLRRLLSLGVREVSCVSRQIEQWLRQNVRIRRPITQIYNGVRLDSPPDGTRSMMRQKLGLDDKAFVVGIVGRLDPIKDHPTLIAAFERITVDAPEARLLVVGDGPERTKLEQLAGDSVLFLGNRNDVPHILQTMDVFALTSLNEGISNTILEAMATGLPVIATDVGGNPELVRHEQCGRLVSAGDVEAIFRAMETYRAQPDQRREHGDNGRRRVQEDFTIERMVRGYEAVYQRVHTAGR